MTLGYINTELRRHAPFTLAGTATGIVIMEPDDPAECTTDA